MSDERTAEPQEPTPEQGLETENLPRMVYRESSSTSTGLEIALAVLVVVAAMAAGYGWLQHDSAQRLASETSALRTSLDQAKAQDAALIDKVNALTTVQAQAQQQVAQAQAQVESTKAAPVRPAPRRASASRTGDPRWKQLQNQLGNQQKQLAENQKQLAEDEKRISETQANLEQAKSELAGNIQSARTDLGGDIARNHDELVALEKKGERNYYEFNFGKSKAYHHTGPVSLALRKSDAKRQYCDLQMLIDDREIARKHVNLYESLTFYPEGYAQPLEVVVNHIDRDSVQGYVSEPKYRAPRPATSPSPAANNSTEGAPASPAPATTANLEHRAEEGH